MIIEMTDILMVAQPDIARISKYVSNALKPPTTRPFNCRSVVIENGGVKTINEPAANLVQNVDSPINLQD